MVFENYIANDYIRALALFIGLLILIRIGISIFERVILRVVKKTKTDIDDIITPKEPDDYFHVYQMYTIRVKNGKRDDLAKFLGESSIMTKIYFTPVHQSHFYRNVLKYKCKLPVTEKLSEQVLTLPMHPLLTKDELDLITSKIKSFFSGN